MKKFLTLFIILGSSLSANSTQSDGLQDAAFRNDAFEIVKIANLNKEKAIQALDALTLQVDMSKYTYEQLQELLSKTNQPDIKQYIRLLLLDREKNICEEVIDLTPEELNEYLLDYPKRTGIINTHIGYVIKESVDSMPYPEMLYLDNVKLYPGSGIIKDNLTTRINERVDLYRQNASAYIQNEQATLDGLKYLMEKATWEYFVKAHEKVTDAYAEIPMVNDNSYTAASQYQRIVNVYFSSKGLTSILQNIANDYCSQVNKTRKEYAELAGKDSYKKLSLTIPKISFHPEVNYSCLNNISVSRSEYYDNMETSSTVSGVVSWIFGPIAGLIAKGIGDYVSIDTLVEDEYNARKEYVDRVHDALRNDIQKYVDKLVVEINRSYKNNSVEYEKDIKK